MRHPFTTDIAHHAISDYFSKLKEKLHGRKSKTYSDVISEVQGSLKQLLEKSFPCCFEAWVER